MSLRSKTSLIILATFFSLIAILYFVFQGILLNSFTELEKNDTTAHLDRVMSAYSDELTSFATLNSDWAVWDDTYNFVQNGGDAYIKSNLTYDTFNRLKLNLLVCVDRTGNIVYGKTFDLSQGKEMEVPPEIMQYLNIGGPLTVNPDGLSGIEGILMLSESPMMVVSYPILTSQATGPAMGFLVMGRYLDSSIIQTLRDVTHFSISTELFNSFSLPADFANAKKKLTTNHSQFVQPVDSNKVAGYEVLYDIFGEPALILRIELPRSIYLAGVKAIDYVLYALIAIGAIFALVVIFFMVNQVMARLTNLSETVWKISDTGDFSRRIKMEGQDELSGLAGNIDKMLVKIQDSQDKLRVSETRYRAIAENIRDGIIVQGNKEPVYFNERICNILGYSREELAENRFTDYLRQEDINKLIKIGDTLRKTGKPPKEEDIWVTRKDGSRRLLRNRFSMLGTTGAILIVTADITEIKQIDEKMERVAQEWRATFDAIKDRIWICDKACNLLRVNKAFALEAGAEPKELIGKKCQLVLPESDDICANCAHKKAVIDGKPVTVVTLSKGKYFEISASPIFDAGEEITASICTARDITERYQMEEALRSAAQKWRATFDGIGEAICLTDVTDKIIQCNQAFAELIGIPFNEIISHKYEEFIAFTEPVSKNPLETMRTTPERQIHSYQRNDRWFNLIIDPVFDENNHFNGTVTILSDITQSKNAAEKLQQAFQLETELRRKLEEEMRRRIEFTRALVHELKTPLTPILASSELLTEELTEEPYLSLAKNVNKGAINLNRRIDELLDLARGEVGLLTLNLQPVDTSSLFEEVIEYMRPVATGNKQALISEIPPLPVIYGDEERIRQILINLLDNALKYTPAGGQITVRAGAEDGRVVVEVQDTGGGIDEEDQKRLFQPYHRLEGDRERFSGLGLGLSLVKRLVELHGGAMSLRSRKGAGSTFSFALPIKRN